MIKIRVVCVGKIKDSYLDSGIKEYLKRLSSYAKVEIIEVKDEKIDNEDKVKELEKNADDFNTRLEIILMKLERIYQDNEQQKLVKEIISELKRELAKGQ